MPMLFATQLLPMVVLLATLAGWPLPPRQQPDQPQRMVTPLRGPMPGVVVIDDEIASRVMPTVAELPDSD